MCLINYCIYYMHFELFYRHYFTTSLQDTGIRRFLYDTRHTGVLTFLCRSCRILWILQKDSIVRWSNVSSFFIVHFIPMEGNAESSLAFGTRDVGVGDETMNIYKHYFIKCMLKCRILWNGNNLLLAITEPAAFVQPVNTQSPINNWSMTTVLHCHALICWVCYLDNSY